MAKILCISDIHFSTSDTNVYGEKINEDLTGSLSIDKLDLLFDAMEEMGPIDLLVFCGDYVFGKEAKEEKNKALEKFLGFLENVEKSSKIFSDEIACKSDYIVIVPGNHDIDRDQEKILNDFKEKLHKYITPFKEKSKYHSFAPTFIFDEYKVVLTCVSTVENSATKNKEINDVVKKIKATRKNKELKESIIDVLKNYLIYDIPSITEETKRKFINTSIKIDKIDKYNDYMKLMVCHHPLLNGIETSSTIKKYQSTIGGYGFMKSAINYGYQLFIHGHIHECSCVEFVDHNMENRKPAIQIGVPQMNIDSDKYGAVLIDTDISDAYFPFTSIFLKLDMVSRKFKQTKMLNVQNQSHISYQGNKILVDSEIKQIIKENIIVKGGDIANVEAASYDCALGYEFKRGTTKYCNWNEIETLSLSPRADKPSYIKLEPKETILIFTYEEFNVPNDMVLHASPISSWLRKGIRVDLSHLVDPGFKGKFCFPITNESDKTITINSREPIVSVEFVKLPNSCEQNWTDRHNDKAKLRLELKE